MSDRGASVMGLDAGSAPIAVAKLHARETDRKISYQQGTAEDIGENTRSPVRRRYLYGNA